MVNSRKTRIWNCSYLCTAFVGQFDFGETDGFFGPMATVIWRVRMSINRILRSRFGFSTCNEKFVKILVYVFESLLPVCPFHPRDWDFSRENVSSQIKTNISISQKILTFTNFNVKVVSLTNLTFYLPAIHSPLIYLWRLCSIWRNSKWIV